MTRYAAFLRGINVGGHNTIKKETLQEAFTALGFKAVATFKQSGNIIFETDIQDPEAIRKAIQHKLNQLLSGSTAVFLRTVPQLAEIIMNSPFKNAAEEGASYWVTFMSEKQLSSSAPITIPKSTAEITLVKDFEAYSVTRGHGDGGKPNPYTESKFKTQATTRNLSIIREITEVYS